MPGSPQVIVQKSRSDELAALEQGGSLSKAGTAKGKFFKPGESYGIATETTLNTEVDKYHKYKKQNLYDFDGDGSMDAAERKRQQDAHERALKKHDAAVKKAFANDAAGGAGQYTTVGSSLAVTTSANVKSDYGLADISMYDLDGDGELDVGKEQEMARAAHKAAVKARLKAEKEALAKQNRELKKRRDHMRYVADEGVKTDDIDFLNDDDEDKTFWLMRHKIAEVSRQEHEEEEAARLQENRLYRLRVKETEHKVETWASDAAFGGIRTRREAERVAAAKMAELRTAVQAMLASNISSALTTYTPGKPDLSEEEKALLQPLQTKVLELNKLLGRQVPLSITSEQFSSRAPTMRPPHELYMGGQRIKGKSRLHEDSLEENRRLRLEGPAKLGAISPSTTIVRMP